MTSELPEPVLVSLSAHERAILMRVTRLSPREAMVFALIGEGYRSKAIAATLDCSAKTIETHVARIRGRLGEDRPIDGDDLTFVARIWHRSRTI